MPVPNRHTAIGVVYAVIQKKVITFNNIQKMKKIKLFVIISLLFFSCGNVKNKVGKHSDGPLVLVFEEQSSATLFSDRIFGKMEMTPLETTDDCLVGERPELLKDDQNYFILERQQQFILRFDKSGKFINRIGRRGGGPGEYQELMDFIINPATNSVEVLASGGKLLRYNYEGAFISSQNFDGYPQSFTKTGSTYWFNHGVGKLNVDGRLLKVSEDGTVIEKFLPLETDWFGATEQNFTQCGDIISFKEVFSHTVYRITDNGPVETTVIDFGKYAYRKDMYSANQFQIIEELRNRGWAYIYRFLENEQFVYISFMIDQNGENDAGFYYYHWLVNKNTGNSVLQKLSPDDSLLHLIDRAIVLTADNELVCMANAQMLKESTDPFFNRININKESLSEISNPVIIRLKINNF